MPTTMPAQTPAPAVANTNHWFILGRESLIAAAEIDAVLSLKKYDYSVAILKTDAVFEPKKIINRLGGTIKIARELANNITEEEIKKTIIENLKQVTGKINFGISIYSLDENAQANLDLAKNFGKAIKKNLKEEGLSVRYVENREAILSSVTVEKNNLTGRGREFLIQKNLDDSFSLAQTEAVQPFEQFSARDFGRPGRDDLSGMLPPKLAMIMINLSQAPLNSTLLDPFCGSGTILSEALLLDYKNLIGSDISEKAVADTKTNLNWTAEKFNKELPTNKVFQSEAGQLSKNLPPKSVDAIVAEPYLGKPLRGQEKKQDLLVQAQQLKELYLQAFQQFNLIIKPKGKIVFIIPRFKFANEWITIDCKNEIEKIGFRAISFFENQTRLVYARPNQRVAREIWRFEKK
ncbi:MAG TPA: DNA methyltransferase [Candidatus Udaeobacter sp.]|nr:DNA methyltransferase [Candidatus Udaeobacter sp.]